jgi:endoglucanase
LTAAAALFAGRDPMIRGGLPSPFGLRWPNQASRCRSFLGAVAASGLLCGCARAASPASGPALLRPPFLASDGRIVDTGNGGISHSEGQGYGLLVAEAAGDRASFDRLWHWTDAHLSRQDVRLFFPAI